MPEEKKNELNLDEWDSLPLNPTVDDWDDSPAGTGAAREEESPPLEAERPAADLPGGETEPVADTPRAVQLDDFGDPLEEEPTVPDSSTSANPVIDAAPLPEAAAASMSGGDFDGPADQTAANASGDTEKPDLSVSSNLEPAAENHEALLPKKVELDLDGMFLDVEPEPPPEETSSEPQPKAAEALVIESDAVTEDLPPLEAVVVKKHRFKLLFVLAPAVLLLGGVGWALYSAFFSSVEAPEVEPAPIQMAEAVFEPAPSPYVPEPGDLKLAPFLITIPEEGRGDRIVELEVVLHYKDQPDLAAIMAAETLLRDTIYRTAQNLGPHLGRDRDLENRLRQNLLNFINQALGQPRLDYVQIYSLRAL